MKTKMNMFDLTSLSAIDQENILKAIKSTVATYMADGYSYGYSVNMAARESKIQYGVIAYFLQKDSTMRALRDHYNQKKRQQKYGFYHGALASAESIALFNEAEGE